MSGKVMQKILEGIEKNLEDNVVIDHIQHNFLRGNSCLSYLNSFHDKITHLADQGKSVDVIFLDVSKSLILCLTRSPWKKISSTYLDKDVM